MPAIKTIPHMMTGPLFLLLLSFQIGWAGPQEGPSSLNSLTFHSEDPELLLGAGNPDLAWGDFNGDGYSDLAVGLPMDSPDGARPAAGKVVVVFGNGEVDSSVSAEIPLVEATTCEIFGASAGWRIGTALAFGNIDSDAYEDLILGIPRADRPGATQAGAVYVVYGSANREGGTIDLGLELGLSGGSRILGGEEFEKLGFSVAAGDFDRDGADDLLLGALLEGEHEESVGSFSGRGRGTIVYASQLQGATEVDLAASSENSLETRIEGGFGEVFPPNGDHLGWSLCFGDLNGDGYEDAILGSPLADGADPSTPDRGGAVVVYGSGSLHGMTLDVAQGVSGSAFTRFVGQEASDNAGWSVASGDFDGDGFDDLAIGAPHNIRRASDEQDSTVAIGHAGKIHLVYGSDHLSSATHVALETTPAQEAGVKVTTLFGSWNSVFGTVGNGLRGEKIGWSLGFAQCIGNENRDLVLGSPLSSDSANLDFGAVSVLAGTAVALGATVDFHAIPPTAKNQGSHNRAFFGKTIAAGGDFNGDHREDFATLGSYLPEPFPGQPITPGVVSVLLGQGDQVPTPTATAVPPTPTSTPLPSPTPDADIDGSGELDEMDLFTFILDWMKESEGN